MYKLFAKVLLLLVSFESLAQDNNEHHLSLKPKDSLCLKDCLLKAHWEAHSRTFVMSTINEGALKDDYAVASGAGIGVLTMPLYGFQVGVSGFFVYNLMSSNIQVVDPLTFSANRYEVALFDVENHTNKNDLDRLEELYLKYNFRKSAVTFGKININTPFFNPQDGRMRPTVEEGVWLSLKESKKIGFNGGWIWEVSPRATVKWYSVANSIGVYPSGVNINGQKSNYADHLESSGMAIANVYYNPNSKLKFNFWNGYLENIMNTALVEMKWSQNQDEKKFAFYHGLQFLHQDAVNYGGNIDQTKTYINKNAQSNVVSTQLGVKTKKINTSINYTHITGDGRYLMPREWGKEVFYTFLPRERNEGFGNLHAMMVKTEVKYFNDRLKSSLGYGYYKLPDVRDYRLNKYGMPSYHQINFDSSFAFEKFLKGLELRMMVVYKIKQGETYDDLRYVYNKVNMMNFNLIVDFKI
jgi:hypothetical protein